VDCIIKFLGIASPIFGAVGTLMLWKGSFKQEPNGGCTFELEPNSKNKIAKENETCKKRDKYGLLLLFFSFVLQILATFLAT